MIAAIAAIALSHPLQGAVEVPFRLGEDAIIVDAVVNSRKVSLMFDTGFSGAVVVDEKVNLGKPTGKITLRDFVGQFEAPTTKITSLKLGAKNIEPEGLEAVMAPGTDYSFSYNTHVDGIMGFGVVSHQVMEINFQKKAFIFHPKSTDISKRVPDNKKTFLLKLLPTGNQSLELEVFTPQGKRMTMALDTGNAFYATTHKDVLERVELWPKGKDAKYVRSAFVASGEVPSWYMTLKDMSIFGVKVPSSVWSVIDLPSSSAESDGTIGYGFLKNFNVTIDFERRRVWMENFSGVFADEPLADIGVTAAHDPSMNRVRVVRVAPDSPAAKAGIKNGDAILSIDGVDELKVGWRKLNKMFEGPKGSKVEIVISQGGQLRRLSVERDFLING